jgi:hypothetical protein
MERTGRSVVAAEFSGRKEEWILSILYKYC